MKWLVTLLLLLASLQAKQLELNIGAEGAVLINAKTGAILFEKNAHEPAFPASTTKIATAIYALSRLSHQHTCPSQHTGTSSAKRQADTICQCCGEDLYSINLNQKFKATSDSIASITPQAKRQSKYRSPPHWLETDGVHIGIKNGEEIPLYDLLCAMLVCSANDASNVIAKGIGGTIPTFMQGVNVYLSNLGCMHTTYNNPHGLHHPDHVTTPYDLALMTKKGLEHPLFRQIVSLTRYDCPNTNLEYERTFVQTNHLLRNGPFSYPKAIGVKTGTTQAAGKNLVAAAEDNGRCLIAVLLGYRESRNELYRDAIKLFETAFTEHKMRRFLIQKGKTTLTLKVKGARKRLQTILPEGLYYDFYPAEEDTETNPVQATVHWTPPHLPIQAGDQVGIVQVIDSKKNILQETPLIAAHNLNPTPFYRPYHFLFENPLSKQILYLSGSGLILLIVWKLRRTARSRR